MIEPRTQSSSRPMDIGQDSYLFNSYSISWTNTGLCIGAIQCPQLRPVLVLVLFNIHDRYQSRSHLISRTDTGLGSIKCLGLRLVLVLVPFKIKVLLTSGLFPDLLVILAVDLSLFVLYFLLKFCPLGHNDHF